MTLQQGDVVWANFGIPVGSAPGYRSPAVVVQSNAFNASGMATIVVVAITRTLKFENAPGNVRLTRGEANLPATSVVNVTQIATIDRSSVQRRIGTLARATVRDIIAGIGLVLGAADD